MTKEQFDALDPLSVYAIVVQGYTYYFPEIYKNSYMTTKHSETERFCVRKREWYSKNILDAALFKKNEIENLFTYEDSLRDITAIKVKDILDYIIDN